MTWHAPQETIHAYVTGRIADADAWSIEAHLTSCDQCRAAVATATATDPGYDAELAQSWNSISTMLPEQGRVRRGSARRGLRVFLASGPGVRGAWLLATMAVLAMAAGLDFFEAAPETFGSNVPVLTLVAPLLPVLGVAASYGAGLDDAGEVIASTPSGGLRLLLARTITVLAVTIPATVVAGLITDLGWSFIWLLPGLALTSLTLALGSVIGVSKAAAALGAGWVLLVAAQALADGAVHILTSTATPGWLAVVALAATAVVVRREAFNQLPLSIGTRSEA